MNKIMIIYRKNTDGKLSVKIGNKRYYNLTESSRRRILNLAYGWEYQITKVLNAPSFQAFTVEKTI